MRRVKCYDCGKQYDFDVDDFCPKCGAFTHPPRKARIGADGSVVRVDGLNERNHRHSFVHAELHAENGERKGTALEGRSTKQPARPPRPRETGGTQAAQALNELSDLLDGLVGRWSR